IDLDALEGEGEQQPSCTFSLAGREWHCKQPDDVPWFAIQSLVGAASAGNEAAVMTQVGALLSAVLVDDEIEDFLKVLVDPKSALTIRRVKPLIEHITTYVLMRTPISPPAASRTGGRRTTGTSKGASSSRATPRKRSAS
ncbi:MAG: hypothetical protein KGR26_11360, partial [Cyanobacteria bacterium REEB65]|nr:hypothetical protein [Cyanobacteria bacterium REEB65]